MLLFSECLHIHLDFETFNQQDLTKIGAYKYAADSSADVLCASFQVGDRAVKGWRPGDPYPFAEYHDRLGRDAFIVAWNSQFERLIWWRVQARRYGWPMPPLEAFVCASAWARSVASAPAKLELAGQFFGQRAQKDMAGHRLMLQMCRPATEAQQLKWIDNERRAGRPGVDAGARERCHHTRENIDRLHDYCDDDVRTEKGITGILPAWAWPEIEAFWENERINDRGVIMDLDFAQAAAAFAEVEKEELARELCEITGDSAMTPRTFGRFKGWALPRMSREAIALCECYDKGVKRISFDADTRLNLIAAAEEDPDFLRSEVFDAIQVLDEAGKSTISKYQAICARATDAYVPGPPRVHGLYMFAGAAQSGRYSSVGLQAHNLVRDVPKEASALIKAFVSTNTGRIVESVENWARANQKRNSPIHALGVLVRPTITGDWDGEVDLVWGDWSGFEARIFPWLSLDVDAEDTLSIFRRGDDIYLADASAILGRKITKENKLERQAYGKVPRLFLQYGGANGAFATGAKTYNLPPMNDKEVTRIVKGWREANAWAPRFWKALEDAAFAAMDYPGRSYSAGRMQYIYEPEVLDGMGALFAILPSGREVCYPDPRIERVEKPWGNVLAITARKGAWRPKKGSGKWPRIALWKGLLAENGTQACQADFLNLALKRAGHAPFNLPICAHTHDELIVLSGNRTRDEERLKKLMVMKPGWQGDDVLPLAAEIKSGFRYKIAV